MVWPILRCEPEASAARFDLPGQFHKVVRAYLGTQPDHSERAASAECTQLAEPKLERCDRNLAHHVGEDFEPAALDASQKPQREVKVLGRHPAETRRGDAATLEVAGKDLTRVLRHSDRDKGANRLRVLGQKTFRCFQ